MARYVNQNADLGKSFGDVFGLLLQYQQLKMQERNRKDLLEIQREDLANTKLDSAARRKQLGSATEAQDYETEYAKKTEGLRTKNLENQNSLLVANHANVQADTALKYVMKNIQDVAFQEALIDLDSKVFAAVDKADSDLSSLLAAQASLHEQRTEDYTRQALNNVLDIQLYGKDNKGGWTYIETDPKKINDIQGKAQFKSREMNRWAQDAYPGMSKPMVFEAHRQALIEALQKVSPEEYIKQELDTASGRARFFRKTVVQKSINENKSRGVLRAERELTPEVLEAQGYVTSIWSAAEENVKFKKTIDYTEEHLNKMLWMAKTKKELSLEIAKVEGSHISPEQKIIKIRQLMVGKCSGEDAPPELRGAYANYLVQDDLSKPEKVVVKDVSPESVAAVVDPSKKWAPYDRIAEAANKVGTVPSVSSTFRKTVLPMDSLSVNTQQAMKMMEGFFAEYTNAYQKPEASPVR